ncbi:DUF421 domain-containing protein [Knoellia sp. LjRoot47]|uniref:DUF421 domain-containing protein n=1 Tax=Knoellia sp. LjRoot47 TaxID=3342330 RepID=UPI003ECEB893
MDIVLRATAIFLLLWLVIRVSGKREVAQLSAFDMIMVVTLGDLVAQGVVQEDYSLSAAALAVTTFCVLSLLLAWTHYRFPVTRPLLSGRARVVVRDGAPLLEVLSSEHLTIEDVEEAAREKGIRRLRDIELCVLEVDGGFSFFTVDSSDDSDDSEGASDSHTLQ